MQPMDWVALQLTCPQAKRSTWILLFRSVRVPLPTLHFPWISESSYYLILFCVPIWQGRDSQRCFHDTRRAPHASYDTA